MEIKEDKTYKTKDGQWIHVKEITRYLLKPYSICSIVTGGATEFEGDSKTRVIREIYNEREFLELIEYEDEPIFEDDLNHSWGLNNEPCNSVKIKGSDDYFYTIANAKMLQRHNIMGHLFFLKKREIPEGYYINIEENNHRIFISLKKK